MRKLHFVKMLTLIVLLISGDAIAQHKLFAVSGQGRGNSPADARQAAEISQLQANITARNTCESAGLIYSPGHAEADADGCIPPGTGAAGVPSGAVLPFNLAACPEGWSALANAEGRFIIGAGSYPMNADDDGNNSAAVYSLGEIGGRIDHQLLVNEIPAHSHEFEQAFYRWTQNGSSNNNKANKGFGRVANTAPAGGGQPHENRPPYIALLYCQKD